MQFLILGLLLDSPLSLYEIRKRFEATISLFYAASFGGIQRALKQLEVREWIIIADSEDTRRRKKLYVVTEAGHRAWRTWMHDPITATDAEPLMLAKVFLLGKVAPQERAACVALLRERISADIDRLRTLAEDLHETEADHPDREVHTYQRLTLEYGIQSHDLALRWLNEVERA